MRIEVPGALIGVEVAVDRALREAGGGRLAGVRVERAFGHVAYLVQFVRGTWLCTATVDARTGEVTTILDDGAGMTVTADDRPAPRPHSTLHLPARPITDLAPAADDPAICYAATAAGIAVVTIAVVEAKPILTLEAFHHTTARQITAVPEGLAGITEDGRVFRLDRDGRRRWEVRLPARLHTVAADRTGGRLLIASDAGAVELGTERGEFRSCDARPVRAAAYLDSGGTVLAGHRGDIRVTSLEWQCEQGEYPERLWVRRDRIYVAGEGGLKEIVPGEGVVCRWSGPAAGVVTSAAVAAGRVFTCGRGVHRHGYATAAYHGLLPAADQPVVVTATEDDTLLAGSAGGGLTAYPIC